MTIRANNRTRDFLTKQNALDIYFLRLRFFEVYIFIFVQLFAYQVIENGHTLHSYFSQNSEALASENPFL